MKVSAEMSSLLGVHDLPLLGSWASATSSITLWQWTHQYQVVECRWPISSTVDFYIFTRCDLTSLSQWSTLRANSVYMVENVSMGSVPCRLTEADVLAQELKCLLK